MDYFYIEKPETKKETYMSTESMVIKWRLQEMRKSIERETELKNKDMSGVKHVRL